jgi:hypothetical protein
MGTAFACHAQGPGVNPQHCNQSINQSINNILKSRKKSNGS